MSTKLKKSKSAARLGAGYGRSLRSNFVAVEEKQRKKQNCPSCEKTGVKRISNGIWYCKKCDKKFASNTYYLNK